MTAVFSRKPTATAGFLTRTLMSSCLPFGWFSSNHTLFSFTPGFTPFSSPNIRDGLLLSNDSGWIEEYPNHEICSMWVALRWLLRVPYWTFLKWLRVASLFTTMVSIFYFILTQGFSLIWKKSLLLTRRYSAPFNERGSISDNSHRLN